MSVYDFQEKPKRTAPAYYEVADLGTRVLAIIIDTMILGVIIWIVTSILRMPETSGGFIVGLLYNGYFWTQHNGQTPGKRMMGLRVVKASGEPIDYASALIRYVGYFINSFVFGIGWVWSLFNDRHQGWHDLLSGTLVVRA